MRYFLPVLGLGSIGIYTIVSTPSNLSKLPLFQVDTKHSYILTVDVN
jgi:hypothetical protein